MTPSDPARRVRQRLTLSGLVLCLGLAVGCGDDGDTIIINEGIDCGLIRNDLLGDWLATFGSDSTTLVNCDDGVSGRTIAAGGGSVLFSNVTVLASPSSTSFQVFGTGSNLVTAFELIANVEADSCLALVQVWDDVDFVGDTPAWVQCIGTFDRGNLSISTVCDSVDLDTDFNESPDTACDLNTSFIMAVALF